MFAHNEILRTRTSIPYSHNRANLEYTLDENMACIRGKGLVQRPLAWQRYQKRLIVLTIIQKLQARRTSSWYTSTAKQRSHEQYPSPLLQSPTQCRGVSLDESIAS